MGLPVALAQRPDAVAAPTPAPNATPVASNSIGLVGLQQTLQFDIQGSRDFERCFRQNLRRYGVDSTMAVCVAESRTAGHLEFSVDDEQWRGDTLLLVVHEGPQYTLGRWTAHVNLDSTYGPVLAEQALARPPSLAALATDAQAYVQDHAQRGYPFARVGVRDFAFSSDSLHVAAQTWSGPMVSYGGVRFGESGEAPVSATFLNRFLRLESGRRYRQSEIDDIGRRLRGLSYLELVREPVVVFENGEAFVYVDARTRRTSRFDFLLGFLPNSDGNDGQLLLTGDATLDLDNALRRGERLNFSFERLQPQSTEVELSASYPYLFDSPFGARVDFGLYRQQEDWLRVNYEAGLVYAFGGADSYEFYYEGGVVQSLSFDTLLVTRTQMLPNTLDARRDGFGLRLRLDKRDAVLDTRRGLQLVVDASAALREVNVELGIRELSDRLAIQADSIAGRTAQYRLRLDLSGFLPFGRRAVGHVRVRGGSLFGGQVPLRNELYRIGGQSLLRGFDEQSIDAQYFGVFTAEARLLLGGGSYLFAFGDQGYVRDPYRVDFRQDTPIGFGAGLRLATGAGALSLTYAYGRRLQSPIDWQRAKIHVGFESRF